jgi:hypothetical protein
MKPGVGVAVVFLALAGFICFEAFQVPIGTVRMPGAGFFPLLLGVLLGLLSVGLLAMSVVGAPGHATRIWPDEPAVLWLVASVLVAVALFERAGFVLTMALFLVAAMRVLGTRSWTTVLTLALGGSIGSYVVFGRVLQIALPSGVLPF